MTLMKYALYAKVVGTKYLGEVEADSMEDAIEKGYQLDSCSVGVCHQCSREIDDPVIDEIEAEARD